MRFGNRAIWIPAAALLMALPAYCPGAAGESASQIKTLMQYDMFYGTDDYFGENSDIAYSDYIKPSGRLATVEAQITEAIASAQGLLDAGSLCSAFDLFTWIGQQGPQYIIAYDDELSAAGEAFLAAGEQDRAEYLRDIILAADPDNSAVTSLKQAIEDKIAADEADKLAEELAQKLAEEKQKEREKEKAEQEADKEEVDDPPPEPDPEPEPEPVDPPDIPEPPPDCPT